MIWIALVIFITLVYLFVFALCQAAKRGDEWMEEITLAKETKIFDVKES